METGSALISNRQELLLSLKKKIFESLQPLITEDYSLLDAPNHDNIGDSLIYEGERAFLETCVMKENYGASIKFFGLKHLPKTGLILFHGGGNFGDLWPQHQLFRKKVITARPNQRVIIFPQTVYYEKKENIIADAAVFNAHPDLTICARDERSFDILRKYFYKNTILLLPDMAFCLDYARYRSKRKTNRILFLKRGDRELNRNACPIEKIVQREDGDKLLEVADWPTILMSKKRQKNRMLTERLNKYLTRLIGNFPGVFHINKNFGVLPLFDSRRQAEEGIQFVNRYDVLYSTRLHGAILSILLGKRVYLLDNSYGKNASFYYTWLSDFEECQLWN